MKQGAISVEYAYVVWRGDRLDCVSPTHGEERSELSFGEICACVHDDTKPSDEYEPTITLAVTADVRADALDESPTIGVSCVLSLSETKTLIAQLERCIAVMEDGGFGR